MTSFHLIGTTQLPLARFGRGHGRSPEKFSRFTRRFHFQNLKECRVRYLDFAKLVLMIATPSSSPQAFCACGFSSRLGPVLLADDSN